MAEDYLVVGAIDFGSAFSGYGYSFRADYERDPLATSVFSWIPNSGGLVSLKTPTCILFDPKGKFDSFGFEAEDKYSDLVFYKEHYGWSYFSRFKMQLYGNKNLSRNMKLKDDQGNLMSAMKVFSASIRYLKDHFLQECAKKQTDIVQSDIHWILTVPAIWGDSAKQFMREAAEQAGVNDKTLSLALEPEVASLFCMNVPVDKFECGDTKSVQIFQPGSKYLVLDAGGGTIDITIHEVEQGGYLKEVYKSNGGNWGGTLVDEEFERFVEEIVGADVFNRFCKEQKADMLELIRDFELKKRTVKPDISGKVRLKMPSTLIEIFEETNDRKNVNDFLSCNARYATKVSCSKDKCIVDAEICKTFFMNSIEQIENHLAFLFEQESLRDVSTIVMVGGYSESPILYRAIKERFENKKVIVPHDAGLAVLKGAVIYGHDPSKIKTRICKYTYGFGCSRPFDEKIHLPSKRFVNALGQVRCINLFDIHATSGQSYRVGEPQAEKLYGIGDPNKTQVYFNFFMSTDPLPFYTNEPSCKLLGRINIDISDTVGIQDRRVILQVSFSGTEIKVTGKEEKTGKQVKAHFDFLG